MRDLGLVSIITPAYNCSKYIGETIESILAQTYPNWEILITDDCSTDNTREVVENYAKKDSRIKLLRLKENSGAGIARNNSIEQAKGRYIAFCDSDDRWYPEKLERQLEFMDKNQSHLSYTSYKTCNTEGHIIGIVHCLPSINRFQILRDDGIGCLTAIYDASIIGKHYLPSIRKRQDWCLWIDIIIKHGKALGLNEELALYRVRNDSISANKIKLLKYNYAVYRDILKFPHYKSFCYLFFIFMPYYFYKKLKQKSDFKFKSPKY